MAGKGEKEGTNNVIEVKILSLDERGLYLMLIFLWVSSQEVIKDPST